MISHRQRHITAEEADVLRDREPPPRSALSRVLEGAAEIGLGLFTSAIAGGFVAMIPLGLGLSSLWVLIGGGAVSLGMLCLLVGLNPPWREEGRAPGVGDRAASQEVDEFLVDIDAAWECFDDDGTHCGYLLRANPGRFLCYPPPHNRYGAIEQLAQQPCSRLVASFVSFDFRPLKVTFCGPKLVPLGRLRASECDAEVMNISRDELRGLLAEQSGLPAADEGALEPDVQVSDERPLSDEEVAQVCRHFGQFARIGDGFAVDAMVVLGIIVVLAALLCFKALWIPPPWRAIVGFGFGTTFAGVYVRDEWKRRRANGPEAERNRLKRDGRVRTITIRAERVWHMDGPDGRMHFFRVMRGRYLQLSAYDLAVAKVTGEPPSLEIRAEVLSGCGLLLSVTFGPRCPTTPLACVPRNRLYTVGEVHPLRHDLKSPLAVY